MAELFRIGFGDVVRLRSGGPDMLVVDVHNDDEVTVAYLTHRGRPHEQRYAGMMLNVMHKAAK